MLVLSRKRGEQIVINEDVVLTVTRIDHARVRLAIEAPKDIPVHRKEVHDAITRDRRREYEAPQVCFAGS